MNPEHLIIPQGRIAIDLSYGRKILSDYLFEVDQMNAGVPFAELGISERRAATMPKVIEVQNDKKDFVKDKIAIINISGMIRAEDGMSSYGTRTIGEKLIESKKNVIGAILKINSGGGYMDGAEAMISAMREFGKPIVTITGNAGSAAYMIAAESKMIFAETEFSQVGSIGVYIDLNKQFKEFFKNNIETAYSETSQNKNKAFRNYIENDDLSGFITMATEADSYFMNHVTTKRKLNPNSKEESLSGGMFYAKDAKSRGLIDDYNITLERAISSLQMLSRINSK